MSTIANQSGACGDALPSAALVGTRASLSALRNGRQRKLNALRTAAKTLRSTVRAVAVEKTAVPSAAA